MSSSPSLIAPNEAARQTRHKSPAARAIPPHVLLLVNRIVELAKKNLRHYDLLMECADEINWDATGRALLTEAIARETVKAVSAEVQRETTVQLVTTLELWAQMNPEQAGHLTECAEEIKATLPKTGVSPQDNILTLLAHHAAASVALLVRESNLSDWKVRKVLGELIEKRLVEAYGPGEVFESGGGDGVGGDRLKLYRSTSRAPLKGEPFRP